MDNRDLWEKEMEDMIWDAGKKQPVPESLQPEAIRQALLEKQKTIPLNRRRRIRQFFAAAAMIGLVCGCGVAWTVTGGKPFFMGGRAADEALESKQAAVVQDAAMESAIPAGVVEAADEAEGTEAEEDKLTYAKDYQEIENVLSEMMERRMVLYEKETGDVMYGEDADYYSMEENTGAAVKKSIKSDNVSSASDGGTEDVSSHSETNVSVEGVMEADQVVTDGEYIYRLIEHTDGKYYLDIVRAEGGEMTRMGRYTCEDNLHPREFFLNGNQLILLSHSISAREVGTCITFIDISDRKKPVKTAGLTQTGRYSQARIRDGYLYTVSGSSSLYYDYGVIGDDDVGEDVEGLIPCLNGKQIPASKIYIPNGCETMAFTTVTSVKLTNPKDFTDSRSIMTGTDSLHMTEESIYLTNSKWTDAEYLSESEEKEKKVKQSALTKTQITKFSYHDGTFTGKATKEIKGTIKDTFAINEYQGTLRVISSISYNKGDDDNAVYVLDEDLKIIGRIEHLAKDERVYSARFQGNIGYFVTYRETDPLFSVDFTDPQNPKILGKLKIPGFSEYMHFYNDHLLFGLGQEVDKDGDAIMKLSMFDISDPTDVREIHKTKLRKISYSTALHDYKSVLIDPEKNLIGFDGWRVYTDDLQYLVYSYDEEKGFVQKLCVDMGDDGNQSVRGVYINDTVYVVDLYSTLIEAYDLRNGKKVGKYPSPKK